MSSLSDLKARFTEKTNLPAKKAYVILAAPTMQGRGMRSKADWEDALERIERVLTPVKSFVQASVAELEVNVVETLIEEPNPFVVEQDLESINEEILDIEQSIVAGNEPERAFVCGFSISQNPKQLYRRLARKYHPDTNKGIDMGLFGILNEVYKRCAQQGQVESQELDTDEWGDVNDPESYEKVKKMFF